MGKPSSSKTSIKNSEQSMRSNISKHKINVSMSTKKTEVMKKKNRKRTKRKINKLFQKLRSDVEQENSVANISQNDTVISLDGTNDITVIEIEKPGNKRKRDSSVIIVNDDELITNHDSCRINSPKRHKSHINCSTPINKTDSKAMKDLIIDNFTNSNTIFHSAQDFNEDVVNLTKEINRDSYLTIDLTTETDRTNATQNTVIDVDNHNESGFRTAKSDEFVSLSNTSLAMSGDSEVTILNMPERNNNKEIKRFASCIGNLNPSDKGKLLELIAQKIFTGCNIPTNVKESLANAKECMSRATETAEDTYIKETILGGNRSQNSIGSNIYHPGKDPRNKTGLRMIVVDGSNVALECTVSCKNIYAFSVFKNIRSTRENKPYRNVTRHTKGRIFSVRGLQICIDYFLRRGHVVKAFVPRFRCKFGKSSDPRLLDSLERRGLVVYTPSREIQGKHIVSYDDRYIVQCAAEFDGIIVTGDNYRDLMGENPRWRTVIENRLLPFTWVNNMIMFPRDPLGRNGPTLEQFLKHPPAIQSATLICNNKS